MSRKEDPNQMFMDDEELKEQQSEHRYKIALIIRYSIEILIVLAALVGAILALKN